MGQLPHPPGAALAVPRQAARRSSLLGDAAHTAHFSVGSGTKMAMEDAIASRAPSRTHRRMTWTRPWSDYEAGAAAAGGRRSRTRPGPSLSWWEHFGRYLRHAPGRGSSPTTSSPAALTDAKLRRRAPDFVGDNPRALEGRSTGPHRSTARWHVGRQHTLPAAIRLDRTVAGSAVAGLPQLGPCSAGSRSLPTAAAWALHVDGPGRRRRICRPTLEQRRRREPPPATALIAAARRQHR